MFAGQGVALDRATLMFWVRRAAWWLRPLYERLLLYIRSQERVYCDETPLPRLDPGRGRTKVCQLWAQAVDDRPWRGPAMPAIGYVFAEGRDTAALQEQMAAFTGILQVDGYAAYKALVRRRRTGAKVRLVFCLSHARRKFVAVFKTTKSDVARDVIARIGAVYAIEERICGTTAETRRRVRQAESRPLMEALKARLLEVRGAISGQSSLAKASTIPWATGTGWWPFSMMAASMSIRTRWNEACARSVWAVRTLCSPARRRVAGTGRSWPRSFRAPASTASIRSPMWPTCWNAWCPAR